MTFLNVLDVPLECKIHLGVDLAKHQSFGSFLEILENTSGGLRNLFRVRLCDYLSQPAIEGTDGGPHLAHRQRGTTPRAWHDDDPIRHNIWHLHPRLALPPKHHRPCFR